MKLVTFHEGHESLGFDDLDAAIQRGFVVDTSSGGHHHTTTDGIDGVRSKARDNGNTPAQKEGGQERTTLTNEDGLGSIVDTEVETTVDEDTDAGDDETTVKTTNTVRGKSLLVDVNQAIVLAFAILA